MDDSGCHCSLSGWKRPAGRKEWIEEKGNRARVRLHPPASARLKLLIFSPHASSPEVAAILELGDFSIVVQLISVLVGL